MSTVKANALKHRDSTVENIRLRADGGCDFAIPPFAENFSGLFFKANPDACVFTASGSSIHIRAGTIVEVAGKIISFPSEKTVTLVNPTPGTDYVVYVKQNGEVEAQTRFLPQAGERKIGGFHYAPGSNATAQNGGLATPEINPYSLWDLQWRPACPDPRGMTLVAGSFWCDIYLTGVDHHVDGTSKFGVTIADGASPPKIPGAFGGNGSAQYGSYNWWEANEVMQSHGKELLSYGEGSTAFYGVAEGTNAPNSADPVTTKLDHERTSKWGVMQATGNLWVWSRDFSYRPGGNPGWNWRDQAGGRGRLYLENDEGLVAAILGGSWDDGVYAGSRSSRWYDYPWASSASVASRGRADHLKLG